LIDRFTEVAQVPRHDYQLVGVTAMLIASKYEEIYSPEVADFVFITDNAYTREQIITQEFDMLTALDFSVTISSSFRFLERFIKISKSDSLIFNYARYLIELPLIENTMLKWKPSLVACSAIYISKKVLRR
jgi:hypothetical protein